MTLAHMKLKLNEAQNAETYSECALLRCALFEDAIEFIYKKVGAKKSNQGFPA